MEHALAGNQLALAAALCGSASAQYFTEPETKTVAPPGLEGVGIDQRLNEQVPLNLTFKDEQGKTVSWATIFTGPSGDSEPGLLQVPDAVHGGFERADLGIEGAEIHAGQAI